MILRTEFILKIKLVTSELTKASKDSARFTFLDWTPSVATQDGTRPMTSTRQAEKQEQTRN